jgi:hypothetical protein
VTGARRPLAAIAILLLLSAGCSNQPTATDVASTDPNAARAQAVQFAECMRDNGISDFPDPDTAGGFTIDAIANGTTVDTESPAFERARSACKELEPAGFTGYRRTPEQQQAALAFAHCIRDHGVKDFPDPGVDDPLIDTNRIPSTEQEGGMTILHAAMQQCGDLARGAGVQP